MNFINETLFFYGITGVQLYIAWALIGVIFIVILAGLISLISFFLKKVYRKQLDLVVMKVQVPRYNEEEMDSGDPRSQQDLAERLAHGEAFFSSIANITAQKGFLTSITGRNDYFSFEIVLEDDLIYFYVAVPENFKQYTLEQVTAQYPDAVIEEVEDYNIFNPQGTVLGAELKFKKEYIFPIKTYKMLESDSLSGITNSLSALPEGSGAAIQLLVRSAHPKWHDWGQKTASKASQGVKVKEAIKDSQGSSIKGGKNFLSSMASGFGRMVRIFFDQIQGDSSQPKQMTEDQERPYSLTQKEQEVVKGIEDKASKAGLEANLRIIVSAPSQVQAQAALDNIVNTYYQFNIHEFGNSFQKVTPNKNKLIKNFIHREFNEKNTIIVNTEEAASLFHFPKGYIDTPNIVWLQSRTAPAPNNVPKEGLFMGYNEYRGEKTPIHIQLPDRRRHMYIIGMTGTGKSKFIDSMIIRDIQEGKGVCFIDPHGDDVDLVLENIPKERRDDVVYFDPSDPERPFGLNMLEYNPARPDDKNFVVDQLFEIFVQLYGEELINAPMFEQYFKNSCYLVMDDPESGSTLMEVPRVLADEEYRAYKLSKTTSPLVKDFWEKEAQKAGGEASLQNMVPYITSKLNKFLANDLLRPIVSQQKTTLDFQDAMANNKILLIKLAKGKIGNLNANLLGMIVIGKILQAAFARADIEEEKREDFFLYIDEFQNFLTESINTILSEARKYRLGLILAHQLLGQLEEGGSDKIRKTIFGNVGTKIAFRIGVDDAEFMAEEFKPTFSQYDLMNMPKYNCAVKLLIDNANPAPFTMKVPWIGDMIEPDKQFAQELREMSKQKYGKSKDEIAQEIEERRKFGAQKEKKPEKEITLEDLFS